MLSKVASLEKQNNSTDQISKHQLLYQTIEVQSTQSKTTMLALFVLQKDC